MHRLLFAALSLLSAVAGAQTAPTASPKFADPAAAGAAAGSAVSSMGRVTLALVVVLAVLFAASWALRQFKLFKGAAQGGLEVVQGVSLGQKERAVLIKVHGQQLLLGVAPGSVRLLLQLPEQPADPSDSTPPNNDKPDFKALLKRSMGLS